MPSATYTGSVLPRGFVDGLFRIAALAGMAASTALALEYRSMESAFCGASSGCAAVRRTGIAYLWNSPVSLPELGLAGFALVFALSLSRRRRLAAWLALIAAACGAALLVYQFTLGRFCWLCVTADVAALTGGAAALALLRSDVAELGGAALRGALSPLRWALLGVLAVVGPALWPRVKPAPDVPASVRAYYADGKINVVEFADFECPFCRLLHAPLKAELAAYRGRVHLVRLNVPLASHPRARDAARAAICAEPSNRREAYADFLFSTEDLARESLIAEAARLGLDRAGFERCLLSPETDRRIERETAVLREAGMEGLPTTYIGSRRFVGVVTAEVLQDALERAARGSNDSGVPAWLYVLLLGAVAAALAYPALHRGGRSDAH